MDSQSHKTSSLRIAQFNVQGLNNKKPLLAKFLTEKDIDICLINETWLKDHQQFRISGYSFYMKNSKNRCNGVGILIKPYLKHYVINTIFYEDIQTIAISVNTENATLSILCVYCPPSSGHLRLNRLRNIIRDLPKPLFISGDFNAHHIAFGCMTTKSRGQNLYDIIDEYDLCILNDGSFTTVNYPTRNPSAIDVSFISPQLVPLCEWSVHNDAMGSYHYPTITNITLCIERYAVNQCDDRFLYHKTDWAKYKELSSSVFQEVVVNEEDPMKSYEKFCSQLDKLKQMAVPRFTRTNFRSRPPAPWWNTTCEQAVIKSYEALKHYRNNPTLDNYINYKRIDALKKYTIKEQKRNGWNKYCNSFNRTTPISKIWNLIKRFRGVRTANKSYRNEFVQPLLDKLSDNSNLVDSNSLKTYFSANNENPQSRFLLDPFSWSEFLMSIQSRKNTSPGLDDFPYLLIKNLPECTQKLFLNILNSLWRKKLIPHSWKTQCVIPILKPDKSPELASSYRPISLSSCLGKIFENMVKSRLDWYVESNNIIPHTQYGFRRGRSCVDSFVSLINDLKNAKGNKLHSVCVFLDVQGAFDSVDPGILVKVLSNAGVPGYLCEWIYNFLTNRILYIKHNNILYGPRNVSKGTMQGATLSPLLYNLYIWEICKYIKFKNVYILQFADDLVLYSSDVNLSVAIENVNACLRQLNTYFQQILNLKINATKSSVMIFGKDSPTTDITYNGEVIQRVTSHKLSFEEHIKYISRNALKGINILKCLAGVTWGADPNILSMLYKSIVRSHFDYSSLIYLNSNHNHKLDVIQNKALKIISGAMCSTPIRAMEVETNIMPLILRRLLLVERYCLKLLSSNNYEIINRIIPHPIIAAEPLTTPKDLLLGISPTLCQIFLKMQSSHLNIKKQSHWPCYTHSYNSLVYEIRTITKSIDSNSDFLKFLGENSTYYTIYTDGSKGNDFVRSAVYDPQRQYCQSFVLDKNCSIYTAEAYAVFEALKLISKIHNCKEFLIITDSLSLIDGLKLKNFSYKISYIICLIKDFLWRLENKGLTIAFMWVPSHKGITGNEIADKTAYAGVNAIDVKGLVNVPMTDFYSNIKKSIQTIWLEFWKKDQERKGKWYGSIQENLPARPWYHKLNVASRDFITTINRLRFGHNTAPAHLKKLRIISSDVCTFCNEESADINHIFFKCQNFNVHRLVLASEISEIEDSDTSRRHVCDLLKNQKCYSAIYKYIKYTIGKI